MFSVLVVDDSSFQRRILRKHLEDANYDVHLAADGVEALRKLQEIQPGCIILDLMMPRMSGFEIIQKIHEQKLNIPIIVNTADIQKTTYEQCMAMDVFEVMSKPVNKDRLYRLLDEIQEQET